MIKEKKSLMTGMILIVVEIIILILSIKVNTKKNLFFQDISAKELFIVSDSIGANYDDKGITAYAAEQQPFEKDEIMSCGPYITLPKGTYDITLHYKTDFDNNRFELHCGESRYLDSLFSADKDGYLLASEEEQVSHIRVLKEIEGFDVQVFYQGIGTLSLYGITIAQTNADVPYKMAVLFMIMILLDTVLLLRNKIMQLFSAKNYKYTVALGLLAIFSSLLIWVNGYYGGHDLIFHVLRIEGIKEALLSGQFPSRIHPAHLRGYGYATGVMYPDLLLYFPAILRILGFDMINSYKCFVFAVNMATIIISFYSFQGIFKDRIIAFAGTVMYVLAPYRIMDLYYRAAVGEYCAMIGLPLIVYALWTFVKAFENNEEKPKWIALAMGYSIVLQAHIITTFIVGIFSLLLGALFIKRFVKKDILIQLIKSASLTIALNLWFLVPFMDYYRLPMNKAQIGAMDENGIIFAQLFTQQILADFPIHSTTLENGIAGEIPYSLGYGILIGVVCFILLVREEKHDRKLGLISFGFGGLAIILSLYQFPWDKIVNKISLFGNIQFPWRYLEIAVIAMVICACVGIESISTKIKKQIIVMIISILAVFGFTTLTDAYLEKAPMNTYLSLNTYEIGNMGEYLLNGTDVKDIKNTLKRIATSSEQVFVKDYKKQGTNMTLMVSSESNSDEILELPVLMYPGYQVKAVKTGKELEVTYGTQNTMRIIVPAGFEDSIQVCFAGKWYWHIAEIISLLTSLGLIGVSVQQKKWKRK